MDSLSEPAGAVIVDNTAFVFQPDPTYPSAPQNVPLSARAYSEAASIDSYNATIGYVTSPGWILTFDFDGTYVQVVGCMIPPASTTDPVVTVQFGVDGANEVDFEGDRTITVPTPFVPWYTVEDLPNGRHTLTINITQATADSPYFVDFIAYATVDATLSSTSTTASTTTSSSSSSDTDTLHPTPSLSPSENSTSTTDNSTTPSSRVDSGSSGSHKSFPLAPVIGAVAGGIVLLAALLALLYYLWRRSQRYSDNDDETQGPVPKPGHAPDGGHDGGPKAEVTADLQALPAERGSSDILPSTPPMSGKPSTHFVDYYPPRQATVQPPISGQVAHPPWLPSLANHQSWAYGPDAAGVWAQPPARSYRPDSRAQTMYSSPTAWDQRSGYSSADWNSIAAYPAGHTAISDDASPAAIYTSPVRNMSTSASPATPIAYSAHETSGAEQIYQGNHQQAGALVVPPAGSVAGSSGLRPATPVQEHVASILAERTAPSVSSPSPPSSTNNLPAHLGTLPEGNSSRRTLGGKMDFDGKESRLTPMQFTTRLDGTATSPAASDEGQSSANKQRTFPPPYAP